MAKEEIKKEEKKVKVVKKDYSSIIAKLESHLLGFDKLAVEDKEEILKILKSL